MGIDLWVRPPARYIESNMWDFGMLEKPILEILISENPTIKILIIDGDE